MRRIKKITMSSRGIYEPVKTEEDVVSEVTSMLQLNGIRVYRIVERIPWGRKTSTPGIPDLLCWVPQKVKEHPEFGNLTVEPAKVFFIEIKRPQGPSGASGGKLRPAQAAFLDQASRDGLVAFWANSWAMVKLEFSKHGLTLKGD